MLSCEKTLRPMWPERFYHERIFMRLMVYNREIAFCAGENVFCTRNIVFVVECV
jgi:hypothetical protein